MLLETMEDLLLNQLRDLYSVETQIEVALPIVVEQSTSSALRELLTERFEATESQIVRLQEICGMLGVSARGPRCLGMAGLLQEAHDTMRRGSRGSLLDAIIIAALQRVAHYEMAVYQSAIAYARQLGQGGIVDLLTRSLEEERAADAAFSRIAEEEVLELGVQEGIAA